MTLVILYYFLIAIMIVGIIGELLPAIPGMSLILIAMLVWGFVTKFAGMGVALTVAFVVLLLSLGVEFLASYLGAQKVGASNWSQIGLVVGLLAGIFGLLPAFFFGRIRLSSRFGINSPFATIPKSLCRYRRRHGYRSRCQSYAGHGRRYRLYCHHLAQSLFSYQLEDVECWDFI